MREFMVFVDDMTDKRSPESAPLFQIALAPATQSCGSMGTKQYFSEEQFSADMMRRLRYTPDTLERFFASKDRHETLMNFPLADEDSIYFGWLPDYDKRR
jgi:hypothetical protein